MLVPLLVLVRVTGSCPDSETGKEMGIEIGWCGWEVEQPRADGREG